MPNPVQPPPALGRLGTIGIITTSSIPYFQLRCPAEKGKYAEEWAAKGFCLGGSPETILPLLAVPLLGAFAIPTMIAGSIVGRTAGELAGVPKSKLVGARESCQHFLSGPQMQAALSSQVHTAATNQAPLPLLLVPKPKLSDNEQELSKLTCYMAGTLACLPPGQNGRQYLLQQGIDTVLEVCIHEHGLQSKHGVNPQQFFFADVDVQLIRVQDGEVLLSRQFAYKGSGHKYLEWMAQNAVLLRAEFDRCVASLTREIMAQVITPISTETAILARNR